ncbi:hypothetical protein FDX01_12655 [Citrobacter sp. wls613]|nr:hypothetical protein E5284_01390 [Citrobacter freundii]TKU12787.1 hypothetical protein FDW88_11115 [Citrobacter sp. wls829]TKU26837.1 hypothetical protein FDW95_15890 [Citrobacter sp. wls718]TKU68751.1 hypothetical protein FDX22_28225 [Citrobacter sp. TBCS-14]TKV19829.1 hypothetical protein FDX01_12655 [Citrobacter sp. wls613]
MKHLRLLLYYAKKRATQHPMFKHGLCLPDGDMLIRQSRITPADAASGAMVPQHPRAADRPR